MKKTNEAWPPRSAQKSPGPSSLGKREGIKARQLQKQAGLTKRIQKTAEDEKKLGAKEDQKDHFRRRTWNRNGGQWPPGHLDPPARLEKEQWSPKKKYKDKRFHSQAEILIDYKSRVLS